MDREPDELVDDDELRALALEGDDVRRRGRPDVGRLAAARGVAMTVPWAGDKRLRSRRWVAAMYHGKGLSLSAIAAELDCDESTVRYWMSRHEIPSRRPGRSKRRRT